MEGVRARLQPGTMVGEYKIGHLLGEGGMGVVYAGTHPEIGKRVAIKVLAPHAADHPDLIHRFKEEARAVNTIRHPNIIDIFAFNQLPDGRHYFVMEYLEGESLTARLERGSMEFNEMRRLLAQICSALQAAHEAGIVHRDLKPDNIWVAAQHLSESRIKLLDFGIAKLIDLTNVKTTQAGVSMGTPHYMPPEQGLGRTVDHRTDIYALGVVLYQIFAGTLPFDGVTPYDIILKHVTEAPLPPSSHRPIAPAAMEPIILDCLAKEPERRPSSMRELGQRIDAAFAAESERREQTGSVTMIPRTPRVTAMSWAAVPGGTARLHDPDSGRVPVSAPPVPTRTTLGAATGERMAVGGTVPTARPGGRGRRRSAVTGAVAVAAIVVGVGVFKRPAPGAHSVNQPETKAASVSPPAKIEAPPLPPEHVTIVVPPPESDGPSERPARSNVDKTPPLPKDTPKRRQSSKVSTGTGVRNSPASPPTAPAKSVARQPAKVQPDCKPNFVLDAQGRKHFKPECF